MSLSASIAPHLPYLRRFSRAVSGSQASGDALVAAVLEAIIADIGIFPEASNPKVGLYKIFAKLFSSIAVKVPTGTPVSAWEARAVASLSSIAPRPRQAFVLVAVEGFTDREGAEILDVSEGEFSDLLNEASAEISRQVATDILIIEDEPLIAMDIEEMVESLGHRVVGTARTHRALVDRPATVDYFTEHPLVDPAPLGRAVDKTPTEPTDPGTPTPAPTETATPAPTETATPSPSETGKPGDVIASTGGDFPYGFAATIGILTIITGVSLVAIRRRQQEA